MVQDIQEVARTSACYVYFTRDVERGYDSDFSLILRSSLSNQTNTTDTDRQNKPLRVYRIMEL